jgi:hypothetical protein
MEQTNKSPSDLAKVVFTELGRRHRERPALSVLSDLLHTLYWASLKTEESQPIHCHIVYLNPDDPDPKSPERIVKDRWNCVPLGRRIPFTVPNVVKIARASDPRTSSFAVYHDRNHRPQIWGLVDQGNRYYEYVNFDADAGPERPGFFQASIVGVGHLIAYYGYQRIAELNINSLITHLHDVLRDGPVNALLQPGIDRFVDSIAEIVGIEVFQDRAHWRASLERDWIATLCRLLLRIRGYRHGGAVLITPDSTHAGLNLQYKASYARLRSALEHRAVHLIQSTYADDIIYELMENHDAENVPIGLYLEESVESSELANSNSELDGCIWFVSLLSRVDGLVLLNPDLEVQGFGVEILQPEPPPRVFRATTVSATRRSLRAVEYHHFGTRHRSMMRYCFHVPGSIGFIISQDGDVRAVARVGGDMVMWENIRLQMDAFVRQRRRHKRPPRPETKSHAADNEIET